MNGELQMSKIQAGGNFFFTIRGYGKLRKR